MLVHSRAVLGKKRLKVEKRSFVKGKFQLIQNEEMPEKRLEFSGFFFYVRQTGRKVNHNNRLENILLPMVRHVSA
jgi:hypothetical protein